MAKILILLMLMIMAIEVIQLQRDIKRHEQAICELLLEHPELLDEEGDDNDKSGRTPIA